MTTATLPPSADSVIQTRHGEVRKNSFGYWMRWKDWGKATSQQPPAPAYPGAPDAPGERWIIVDEGVAALMVSHAAQKGDPRAEYEEQQRAAAQRTARGALTRLSGHLRCRPEEVHERVARLHADARYVTDADRLGA